MDGVPFMISEKFSCVPESVSFMHDPLLLSLSYSWHPQLPGPGDEFLPDASLSLWMLTSETRRHNF